MSLEFACEFSRPTLGPDRSGFALKLEFSADDGVTALWGPSGCGKTTTLQLIAGLLQPDHGRIALDGQVLVDTTTRRRLPAEARRIGLVFQDSLLFPHLTVEDNLVFGQKRRANRMDHAETGVKVDFARLVAVLELGELLQRKPVTLSGGQARRVALGRALMCSPRLLMLDEPVTGLEDELKERIVAYLERIRDEWQVPMLLVTHERAMLEQLEAKVIKLDTAGNGH